MTLKARITDDMKDAMRAKDAARLSTIRLLLAAIKQREVDERKEIADADVLAIIDKMIKQRRDSIAQFEAGKREDLAAVEQRRDRRARRPTMPQQLTRGRDRRADRRGDRRRPAPPGAAGMGKVMARAQAQARRPGRHGRGVGAGQGQARRLRPDAGAASSGALVRRPVRRLAPGREAAYGAKSASLRRRCCL